MGSLMHIYTLLPALFGYQSVTSLLSNGQSDALSMSQGEPWLLALKGGWRSNLSAGKVMDLDRLERDHTACTGQSGDQDQPAWLGKSGLD